ncbi:MAG: hypothetical protein ABIO83_07825 [Ilumatobacteraceae bacterium]
MIGSRSQLLTIAGRLGAIGATAGIAAGITQATIGSHIPNWTGNKAHPVALGLFTIALSASALSAARTLRAAPPPSNETLSAITLWLAIVGFLCSTTVGRLWAVPGLLVLAAAGVTLTAFGWHHFQSVVAKNWLRGLLGTLGALELLMAVSAAPTITIGTGLVAGGALIAAAVLTKSGKQTTVSLLVAASLPFAIVTWWTIVTPLLTVVAFVIGVAATRDSIVPPVDAGIAAPLEVHSVG